MKEYLDKCLIDYFNQILDKKDFKLKNSEFINIGGIYRFENNHLKFNIINDRGIIETSISSIYSKKTFDFELVYFYFLRQTQSVLVKPKFGKNILSKRMDLKAISLFFDDEYNWIESIFDKTEYIKTETELLNIGDERAKLLFGNF